MSNTDNTAPMTAADMLVAIEQEEKALAARKQAAREMVERETHAKREATALVLAEALLSIKDSIEPLTPGVYAVNVAADGTTTVIAQTARRSAGTAAQVANGAVNQASDVPRGGKAEIYAAMRAEGKTFTEIAKDFGVQPSTVKDMVDRFNGTGGYAPGGHRNR